MSRSAPITLMLAPGALGTETTKARGVLHACDVHAILATDRATSGRLGSRPVLGSMGRPALSLMDDQGVVHWTDVKDAVPQEHRE